MNNIKDLLLFLDPFTCTCVCLQYSPSLSYGTEIIAITAVEARYIRMMLDLPEGSNMAIRAEFYGCVTSDDMKISGMYVL